MAAGSPPAALLGRAETPIRDRLITTLFLAAVLHGMLILGVSFVSDRGSGAPAPGLDVQLLAEEAPDETRDRPASYLAQRSRAGAGTTTARVAARTPLGLPAEEAPEAADEKAEPRPEAAAEALLTTTASRVDVRYSGAIDGPSTDQTVQSAAAEAAALRAALAALDAGGEDPGEKVQLTGPKTTAEGWVSPDTQASVVAPYMDAWRRKVERLGTLNYPKIASVKTPLVLVQNVLVIYGSINIGMKRSRIGVLILA